MNKKSLPLKLTGIAFSALTGLVFLYSSYAKLFPIEPFEYHMVETAKIPWFAGMLEARLIIGVEAALGILLILNLYGRRKIVLKIALWLLAIFSAYLIFLWVSAGNSVNCGCFGERIWMSPSASLVKNLILFVLLLFLLKYHRGFSFRWSKGLTVIFFFMLTMLPFVLNPMPPQKPDWLGTKKFKLELNDPTLDSLRRGKHIIAFLSYSCPHCRRAAQKLRIMKERNPELPIYFMLAGPREYVLSFWDETQAKHIPHTELNGSDFFRIAGGRLPVIYWVNNGWVEAKTIHYPELNQEEIEQWLKRN